MDLVVGFFCLFVKHVNPVIYLSLCADRRVSGMGKK